MACEFSDEDTGVCITLTGIFWSAEFFSGYQKFRDGGDAICLLRMLVGRPILNVENSNLEQSKLDAG